MSYRPPYEITTIILKYIQDISQQLGQVKILNLNRPPTKLRKENRIKSIYGSLAIEGNSLSMDMISSIIDDAAVIGPLNEIREVKNAIDVYNILDQLKSKNKSHLLKAHKILMKELIENPGKFRKKGVGIIKGSNIQHLAPPAHLVPPLITKLFDYLKNYDELTLIKSCVFHYEFEFIHPFADGNGRMGRLWQTKILMEEFEVFQYIPIEHMILRNQNEYYQALAISDNKGNSTYFIEFMLSVIKDSLSQLLSITNVEDSFETRIEKAKSEFKVLEFSRLNYMNVNKSVSSATASRDLKKAFELGILSKKGQKRTTVYKFK